jgi:Na+/H+ antiporter NhaD/arsenite permease-like protein
MALDEREALTDRPLLVRSLVVLALVTVAFALHGVLHYEPSVVALLGAGSCSWWPAAISSRSCARSSGPPWPSSRACSSWSGP